MRSPTRGQLAVLAALLAVVACDDRAGPTTPLPGTSSALLQSPLREGTRFTERGAVTLRAGTRISSPHLWSATATMTRGIAAQEGSASPIGALAIAAPRTRFRPAGAGRRFTSFIDDHGDQVDIAWSFARDGGPAQSVRMYVNGALRMATEYQWLPSGAGFTLASSTRRLYAHGVEQGSVSAAVSSIQLLASRGAAADAIAHLASRVGGSLLPRDLEAAVALGPCRMEYLEYTAATAVLAGAVAAWEEDPFNPVLIAAVVAASSRATIAEMRLWLCQENAAERQGASGGGGGGAASLTPIECLVDPYAPGCDQSPVERQ